MSVGVEDQALTVGTLRTLLGTLPDGIQDDAKVIMLASGKSNREHPLAIFHFDSGEFGLSAYTWSFVNATRIWVHPEVADDFVGEEVSADVP